jgi:hypothetical protein
MQHSTSQSTKQAKAWAAAIVIAMAAALAAMPAAHADEAQAKALFKAMSDYIAAQKLISFDTDTSLEIVTKDDQKLALTSSGMITLSRPDKLRATRRGGFSDVAVLFDGKTMTSVNKDTKQYAQVEIPGTIDNLVDVLRDKYNRPVPGADLLLSDMYGALMPLVTDVKDLGSGVIQGTECDHFAFRTKDVDWQIWIAQGARPYPCRYVITSTKVAGEPQYTVDIRNWKTGTDVAAETFSFKAPPEFKKVKPGELLDTDELPAIFRTNR